MMRYERRLCQNMISAEEAIKQLKCEGIQILNTELDYHEYTRSPHVTFDTLMQIIESYFNSTQDDPVFTGIIFSLSPYISKNFYDFDSDSSDKMWEALILLSGNVQTFPNIFGMTEAVVKMALKSRFIPENYLSFICNYFPETARLKSFLLASLDRMFDANFLAHHKSELIVYIPDALTYGSLQFREQILFCLYEMHLTNAEFMEVEGLATNVWLFTIEFLQSDLDDIYFFISILKRLKTTNLEFFQTKNKVIDQAFREIEEGNEDCSAKIEHIAKLLYLIAFLPLEDISRLLNITAILLAEYLPAFNKIPTELMKALVYIQEYDYREEEIQVIVSKCEEFSSDFCIFFESFFHKQIKEVSDEKYQLFLTTLIELIKNNQIHYLMLYEIIDVIIVVFKGNFDIFQGLFSTIFFSFFESNDYIGLANMSGILIDLISQRIILIEDILRHMFPVIIGSQQPQQHKLFRILYECAYEGSNEIIEQLENLIDQYFDTTNLALNVQGELIGLMSHLLQYKRSTYERFYPRIPICLSLLDSNTFNSFTNISKFLSFITEEDVPPEYLECSREVFNKLVFLISQPFEEISIKEQLQIATQLSFITLNYLKSESPYVIPYQAIDYIIKIDTSEAVKTGISLMRRNILKFNHNELSECLLYVLLAGKNSTDRYILNEVGLFLQIYLKHSFDIKKEVYEYLKSFMQGRLAFLNHQFPYESKYLQNHYAFIGTLIKSGKKNLYNIVYNLIDWIPYIMKKQFKSLVSAISIGISRYSIEPHVIANYCIALSLRIDNDPDEIDIIKHGLKELDNILERYPSVIDIENFFFHLNEICSKNINEHKYSRFLIPIYLHACTFINPRNIFCLERDVYQDICDIILNQTIQFDYGKLIHYVLTTFSNLKECGSVYGLYYSTTLVVLHFLLQDQYDQECVGIDNRLLGSMRDFIFYIFKNDPDEIVEEIIKMFNSDEQKKEELEILLDVIDKEESQYYQDFDYFGAGNPSQNLIDQNIEENQSM